MVVGGNNDQVTRRCTQIAFRATNAMDELLLSDLSRYVVYGGTIIIQHADGTLRNYGCTAIDAKDRDANNTDADEEQQEDS